MKTKKFGFTLIELLVVISIIGVLAALSLVGLRSAKGNAKKVQWKSDVRGIGQSIESYAMDNGEKKPLSNGDGTIECLTEGLKTGKILTDGQYLSSIPFNKYFTNGNTNDINNDKCYQYSCPITDSDCYVYLKPPTTETNPDPIITCTGENCTISNPTKMVTQIAAGTAHTCALKIDHTVICWGNNYNGELGDNTTTRRLTPVVVKDVGGSGQLNSVTAITAGGSFTCALKSDKTVVCWGDDQFGQLGNDNTAMQSTTPVLVKNVEVSGILSSVIQIEAGRYHACALKSDKTVVCWGYNHKGQIGDGTSNTNRLIPVDVVNVAGSGQLNQVTAITAGEDHTCALMASESVVCWGDKSNALGYYIGLNDIKIPTIVKNVGGSDQLSSVTAISAGNFHTCALKLDKSVVCWGENMFGQLGLNNDQYYTNPKVVKDVMPSSGNLSNITAISAGGFHTCALKSDNSMVCWGGNEKGQIGKNSSGEIWVAPPVFVKNIESTGQLDLVTILGTGYTHSCALKVNQTLACWGMNYSGQLGDGTRVDKMIPVQVQL